MIPAIFAALQRATTLAFIQRREQVVISPQDVDELRKLEESLWISQTRFDKAYMERVLSPEFVEFGRSGNVYSREETLVAAYQDIRCTFPLKHFTAHLLDANVFLVTYMSERIIDGEVFVANRSSIWLKMPQGWQLRFHQGTPVYTREEYREARERWAARGSNPEPCA